MASQLKHSQRRGQMSAFKKWISRLASAQYIVLPVPGEEVFRSKGIHLHQLGYEIAANPRQANLMMVAGPINEYLAQKAAIAFVQMPRPRCLVFVEVTRVNHLPPPDFKIQGQANNFIQLKDQLKNFFANPFSEEADALKIPFIKEMLEEQENQQQGHQHHHGHGDHQHGEENDEHEQEDDHSHHDYEHQRHHQESNDEKKEDQHEQHSHGEHQGHNIKHDQQEEHEGHQHQEHETHDHSHEGHEGDEHGHGDHGDHGGGGFMSMVIMTKDMPPAMDGLRMEHNQAWFGPFFPGLTGGLAFHLMLDGDTVMQVQAEKQLGQSGWNELCGLPSRELPEKIATINPLAPATYRILAEVALQKLSGNTIPLTFSQITALEKERTGSHLNWLATLGKLTGNHWLYNAAVQALADFQRNNNRHNIRRLVQKVLNFKYLKKKLSVGVVPEQLLHHTSGPVARAANLRKDLRADDENYQKINFQIVTLDENNAWGRFKLRLLEIEQSMDLIQRIENEQLAKAMENSQGIADGSASFALETPQGVTSISLVIKQGKVEQLQLQPVANINLSIATEAVSQMELSEALITIHSLDINPYEIIVK